MTATAIIAFREFLEAFLIVGVFLGLSKTLGLKKEAEIALSAAVGIILSLLLAAATYFFGDAARGILTERNADLLESYLLIFSGLFIAYVVFSLHGTMNRARSAKLTLAEASLQARGLDASLFFMIVFLVLREGFEVALFTSSVSLFSTFAQNFAGLLLGFAAASAIGISTFFAYAAFPVASLFKWTEYLIVLLGASLVQNGLTRLFATHFNTSLSGMFPFHLQFLPGEESLAGHLLQGLFGIDREFSLARLAIMGVYIAAIYLLFMRQKGSNNARPLGARSQAAWPLTRRQ